jgi:hypothetical protein
LSPKPALLRHSSLELGALEYMTAEIAEYAPNINYITAWILLQSKANEYKIFDRKVGDHDRG